MTSLAPAADLRVRTVSLDSDRLSVELMDGRMIAVPLVWYPRPADGTDAERANWRVAGGAYGVHRPDIDEDLSTEGMLRGAPAAFNPDMERSSRADMRAFVAGHA